jgi:hypothetical protein
MNRLLATAAVAIAMGAATPAFAANHPWTAAELARCGGDFICASNLVAAREVAADKAAKRTTHAQITPAPEVCHKLWATHAQKYRQACRDWQVQRAAESPGSVEGPQEVPGLATGDSGEINWWALSSDLRGCQHVKLSPYQFFSGFGKKTNPGLFRHYDEDVPATATVAWTYQNVRHWVDFYKTKDACEHMTTYPTQENDNLEIE